MFPLPTMADPFRTWKKANVKGNVTKYLEKKEREKVLCKHVMDSNQSHHLACHL